MREWSKISRPDNAKQLRAMAKETQFAGDPDYNTEQWYELPSGEIMLCKARERYSQYHRRVVALNREWWVFDMSEDPPKIIEHDGVVIA